VLRRDPAVDACSAGDRAVQELQRFGQAGVANGGEALYGRPIDVIREDTLMNRITALIAASVLVLAACADEATDAPEAPGPVDYGVMDQPDAAATFISPVDGETVTSPFTVVLSATGVELAPAGIPAIGEGHLHVTVDIGCYATGESIPGPSEQDEAAGRFHLGDGSDTRQIELAPGTYELCVQLADGVHRAFGSTQTITVTVE